MIVVMGHESYIIAFLAGRYGGVRREAARLEECRSSTENAMPVSTSLNACADRIDRLTTAVGRGAAWASLFIVLAQFALVVMRYGLDLGSIWLTESVLYGHAVLFMLAAAWTLKEGGHVRVDVFYVEASPRAKAVIDLVGALVLLIPFALAILLLSLPYVGRSWATLEGSRETSGLPFVFLLKTLIPLFALLIGLQGVAQAVRAALVLAGAHGRPD
jgi:TRAP-type mannitol/chloroaromatic compound transport system permease small subunit